MDAGLENKLIECLDALESGQTIEQTLARYPEDAAALRPLLETASQISQIRVAHSLEAQAKSRERFLAEGAALAAAASRPKAAFFGLGRLALSMASLLILLVVVGAGIVFAASETVPGDALYGTKRIVEEVRLSLAPGSSNRASLVEKFRQERLREVDIVLQDGRSVDVMFSGVVEAIDGDTWHVSGVTVTVDAATQVDSQPQIGWTVEVRGMTEAGQVLASEVTVVERTGDEPEPEPDATKVEETSVEPSATPSHTPSPTPTATPTATSTPSATVPDAPQPVPTVEDDSNHDDASAGDGATDEQEGSEDDSSGDSDQSDDDSGGGNQEGQGDDGQSHDDGDDDHDSDDDQSDDDSSSDEEGRDSDDDDSSDEKSEDKAEDETVRPAG